MNNLRMDKVPKYVLQEGMGLYDNFKKFLKDQIVKFGSPEVAAENLGVDSRSIRFWLNNERTPRRNTLKTISERTGYSVDEIVSWGDDSEAIDEDEPNHYFVGVPYLEAEASGAYGESTVLSKKIKSFIAFQSHWIYSKGNPENMGAMRVIGPSMEPTIPDGSLVLIDTRRTEIVNHKIFVIEHNEGIKVKRLRRRQDGTIYLLSDNEFYEEIMVEVSDHFTILGRVLWVAYEVD